MSWLELMRFHRTEHKLLRAFSEWHQDARTEAAALDRAYYNDIQPRLRDENNDKDLRIAFEQLNDRKYELAQLTKEKRKELSAFRTMYYLT